MKVVNSHLKLIVAAREMREGRRLGIRTIAAESGASRPTVQALLNNKWKHIPRDDMAAICRYFEITPGDIFKLEDAPEAAA
jgi:DNA-binding Xre family transcriptional regulator